MNKNPPGNIATMARSCCAAEITLLTRCNMKHAQSHLTTHSAKLTSVKQTLPSELPLKAGLYSEIGFPFNTRIDWKAYKSYGRLLSGSRALSLTIHNGIRIETADFQNQSADSTTRTHSINSGSRLQFGAARIYSVFINLFRSGHSLSWIWIGECLINTNSTTSVIHRSPCSNER